MVEALGPRGAAESFGEGVQRLIAPPVFDVIAARRRIADAVIDAGKYPL